MGIKKYAAAAITLLILTFLTAAANAAELKAYYLVEGNYDKEKQAYTVDVYLDTEVYLAAGTFGMTFGDNVKNVIWNDGTEEDENTGYMQIETANFDLLENEIFAENEAYFKDNRYIVAQWGLNETDISSPIKLGSFTIEGVTSEAAEGWGEAPFKLLDWTAAKFYNDELFKEKDETDGYGKSLNEEIWRVTTEEERENGAPAGYYQGCAYDDGEEWIDIGFKFTSNLNKEILITGIVHAYNPNNDIQVIAYGDKAYTGEITGRTIYPDGRVTYTYGITVKDAGDYTLMIQKNTHLTYSERFTIPDDTDGQYSIKKELTMICGDINSDGYVKLPDRAGLIRFLNKQLSNTANPDEFNTSDLNGDGYVNLFDLSILKANLDKAY